MRTIKFKGKCCHSDAWAYGNLVDYGEDEYPEIQGFDVYHEGNDIWQEPTVERDTIGQVAGLYDKNGKEIYEGDIVRCNEFVYEVVYERKRFASFALRRDKDMYDHYFGEAMECDACEVIGNIHDNPELVNPAAKGGEQ